MEPTQLNPDCGRIRSELAAHLYGELASDARAAVDQHLERCAACRDERAALEDTRALLARWETPATGEDPRALARAIAEQGRAAPRGTGGTGSTGSARLVRWSAALSGAAAALLFLLAALNTTVSSAGGRFQLSFALPGARPADAPLGPELEGRLRAIAAQEVSTRAASLERDQEQLFQRCSLMTREELQRLAQAVEIALAHNQQAYDTRLANLGFQAARADREQRLVISDLVAKVLPVSNSNR